MTGSPRPRADYSLGEPISTDRACTYEQAYLGACEDPAVTVDPPRCPDHAETTCRVCDAPATHGCRATFGVVCGAPLCDDHSQAECPVHPD